MFQDFGSPTVPSSEPITDHDNFTFGSQKTPPPSQSVTDNFTFGTQSPPSTFNFQTPSNKPAFMSPQPWNTDTKNEDKKKKMSFSFTVDDTKNVQKMFQEHYSKNLELVKRYKSVNKLYWTCTFRF